MCVELCGEVGVKMVSVYWQELELFHLERLAEMADDHDGRAALRGAIVEVKATAREVRKMTDVQQREYIKEQCTVHIPPVLTKEILEFYGSVWVDPWEQKRWDKIDAEKKKRVFIMNVCATHLPWELTQEVWEFYGHI
jgi:hypothetical protein